MAELKTKAQLHERLRRELAECVKCGSCMAACPVYGVYRTEASNMRGKLALLQVMEKGRKINPGVVQDTLSKCLSCLNCKILCPNKVDTALATIIGKYLYARPTLPRRLFRLVRRFARRHAFGRMCSSLSYRLRLKAKFNFPIALKLLTSALKYFSGKSEHVLNRKNCARQSRIIVFMGCLYAGDESAAESVLKLVETSGLARKQDVSICNDACCGVSSLLEGDIESYGDAVVRLMNIFESRQIQKILFLCPECWYAWQRVPDFLNLTSEEEKIWRKGIEFFTELSKTDCHIDSKLNKKVAFHEACLFSRFGCDRKAVLNLLENASFEKPLNVAHDGTCCGAGGGLLDLDAKSACNIAGARLAELRAAGAEMVVTHCKKCKDFFEVQPESEGLIIKTLLDVLADK